MCSIVLYLHINRRCHILRHLFCLHHRHKFFTNEERIIRISFGGKSRIGRPFADNKIPTLYRPRSFAVAQILRVSPPARKAKLLVNQTSGLRLIPVHHSRDGFRPLCTLLLCFPRSSRLNHCQLLCQFHDFLFLLGNNRFQTLVSNFDRHNKLKRNISPVPISFHKPNCKIVCQGQQGLCFVYGVRTCMYRRVSRLA